MIENSHKGKKKRNKQREEIETLFILAVRETGCKEKKTNKYIEKSVKSDRKKKKKISDSKGNII